MRNLAAPRVPSALIGALLIGACAPLQWERTGTDAAVLNEDLQQCEQQARFHARQYAEVADNPTVIVTQSGQVGITHSPHAMLASDPRAEYDSLTSCMRDKGYREAASR